VIMIAGRIAVAVEGPLPPDPEPTGFWKVLV
jgi:hypothetical protein